MRFPRRTYVVTTNTCVILGVASAFGFDRTEHMAWLALGGCAAIGAIAIYFIQHWQIKLSTESTRPASLPANLLAIDPWTTPVQPFAVPSWLVGTERARRSSYWKTTERRPANFSHLSYAVVKHPDPVDPAEIVSGIIRQLQTIDKRIAYEFVIATDGSITLRFRDDVEQSQASELPQPTANPEAVH